MAFDLETYASGERLPPSLSVDRPERSPACLRPATDATRFKPARRVSRIRLGAAAREIFRRLWSAQFASNVGSWMQTVAAQWVMISLTHSAVLISAIQAASSLPALALAIPAGALGDLVDRRLVILFTQALMLLAAGALAVLAALGGLTPASLLGLLFVIGCGVALSAPTWQTLQPELVASSQRAQAIALGSVNQNLARAIGPAVGGVLLAATSATVVFSANAVSFVGVVIAVAVTAVPLRQVTLPREHALEAVRAGGRFVANSPTLLALIVRNVGFIFGAGALWALLPLIANQSLDLDSTGYGLLLGCVGVGALLAATYGPILRQHLAPQALYLLAAGVIASSAVALAVSSSVWVDAGFLVVAGAAWIVGIGLLGAAYQTSMPSWVKARGMSYYLIAFQGSNALGALGFGAIAQATSVKSAFLVMAGFLLAVALATWRLALPRPDAELVEAVEAWPLPDTAGRRVDEGPILVEVEWAVPAKHLSQFLRRAKELRRLRRRAGAISWRLYETPTSPPVLVETFRVGSWADHERQHQRMSRSDLVVIDELAALLVDPGNRPVRHLLAVPQALGRVEPSQASDSPAT